MTNHCPFCGNYAYAAPVGDAYRLDCRYCEIQVEITKRAYSARCPNPVVVLDYIREKMKGSTRPRIDMADMKRTSSPLVPEEKIAGSDQKEAPLSEPDEDLLKTTAKAIGTTLGKIVVKAGIVKPPARKAKARKKVVSTKKASSKVAKKAPSKTPAKGKKPTAKSKQAK